MLNETADILSRDKADRLAALEERLFQLARVFEPLIDIRAAATDPAGDQVLYEAALAQIRDLTELLQSRKSAGSWDATDQLAARLLLVVLARVAVQFRSDLIAADAELISAHEQLRTSSYMMERVLKQLGVDPDTD